MKTNRWSPYVFSNGKNAKNRVVVPPMASQTADENGFVTNATIAHYQKLAESQAGLVFVEYSFVHKSGKGEENQLGIDSDENIEGLRKVAQVIHQSGALAGMQIVHTGGKAESKVTGQALLGASTIAVPVKGWEPEVPVEMSLSEIETSVQWYVDAASRTYQAGFDFVELHAAHGYGLNQWLSPITNHRKDEYGGSIVNRAQILFKIVEKIKKEVPGLLLAIRLPAHDHVENGLSTQEMIWVVKNLQDLNVDLIDVSSGIGGWRRPEGRSGQGYLLDDAATLKQHLNIPVIGVGGIESGDFIDDVLSQTIVDFTAVGRAVLKAPKDWGNINLNQSYSEAWVS